jgi:RND family efflux transporter MFP subunit
MLFPNTNRSPGAICRAALAAGIASALAACGPPEAAPAPQPRLVRSIIVAAATNAAAAEYTGEVRSRYETDLSFQVGGKVVSRAADVGATVTRGQVLAQLDDTDLRLRLQASRSQVEAAEAELVRARAEEARYRDLLERGLTTRAAYLTQQTNVKTAQSRDEQATADLKLAEQRLGYATLRAEDDGVVTDVAVEVGAVVAAGQRVLGVARPHELEAVFNVPDSRIGSIRNEAQVDLTALVDPSSHYAARVREISPTADPLTRTFAVRASIDAPPAWLRLGMTLTVMLHGTADGDMIALPATALFQQGAAPAVWVVKDGATLELRRVEVARYESTEVLVEAGLANGERVVTAGVHRLADGESVRLMEDRP